MAILGTPMRLLPGVVLVLWGILSCAARWRHGCPKGSPCRAGAAVARQPRVKGPSNKGPGRRNEEDTMRKAMIAMGAGAALGAAAWAQTAEDAVGVWENPENKSQNDIYECGANVGGKLVKVVAVR